MYDLINCSRSNEPFAASPCGGLCLHVYGLAFETSIGLLAGSTRYVPSAARECPPRCRLAAGPQCAPLARPCAGPLCASLAGTRPRPSPGSFGRPGASPHASEECASGQAGAELAMRGGPRWRSLASPRPAPPSPGRPASTASPASRRAPLAWSRRLRMRGHVSPRLRGASLRLLPVHTSGAPAPPCVKPWHAPRYCQAAYCDLDKGMRPIGHSQRPSPGTATPAERHLQVTRRPPLASRPGPVLTRRLTCTRIRTPHGWPPARAWLRRRAELAPWPPPEALSPCALHADPTRLPHYMFLHNASLRKWRPSSPPVFGRESSSSSPPVFVRGVGARVGAPARAGPRESPDPRGRRAVNLGGHERGARACRAAGVGDRRRRRRAVDLGRPERGARTCATGRRRPPTPPRQRCRARPPFLQGQHPWPAPGSGHPCRWGPARRSPHSPSAAGRHSRNLKLARLTGQGPAAASAGPPSAAALAPFSHYF